MLSGGTWDLDIRLQISWKLDWAIYTCTKALLFLNKHFSSCNIDLVIISNRNLENKKSNGFDLDK